jgi:hypothetical protein
MVSAVQYVPRVSFDFVVVRRVASGGGLLANLGDAFVEPAGQRQMGYQRMGEFVGEDRLGLAHVQVGEDKMAVAVVGAGGFEPGDDAARRIVRLAGDQPEVRGFVADIGRAKGYSEQLNPLTTTLDPEFALISVGGAVPRLDARLPSSREWGKGKWFQGAVAWRRAAGIG